MSTPSADVSVADRINALMKALPPKEGRRSRLGHISIEDFAEMLGTTKQRVIDWRRGASYPDEMNRRRLADISGGLYLADDFRGPSAERRAELTLRVAAVEEKVGETERRLLDRLRELEAAFEQECHDRDLERAALLVRLGDLEEALRKAVPGSLPEASAGDPE